MITREILETQRSLYVKGRDEARASISAFNGAVEAMDSLLAIQTDLEAAKEAKEKGNGDSNGKKQTEGESKCQTNS